MEPRTAARYMLEELEQHGLIVCKIRNPERQSWIRVTMEVNCEWYRAFCSQFGSTRRRKNQCFDTCIKRAHTIRALRRIIAGEDAGVYEERLRPFIEQFPEIP